MAYVCMQRLWSARCSLEGGFANSTPGIICLGVAVIHASLRVHCDCVRAVCGVNRDPSTATAVCSSPAHCNDETRVRTFEIFCLSLIRTDSYTCTRYTCTYCRVVWCAVVLLTLQWACPRLLPGKRCRRLYAPWCAAARIIVMREPGTRVLGRYLDRYSST
jgi:hypothetical protein